MAADRVTGSYVSAGVRLLLALAILGLAAATAAAEPQPVPKHSVGIGFVGQARHVAGLPNRNLGANLELALGRARWQYFAELGVLAVSVGEGVVSDHAGTMGRAGLGVRWLARSFDVERLRMNLELEAFSAVQHIRWSRGADSTQTQPELGAGFAWTFWFLRRDLAFRTSVRLYFMPTADTVADAVCRGTCPTAASSTAGYMVVTGFAW